ncbi:hypothetical protein B296_00036123 [Ensete ventricosum]|uniref:Uncharacterized protein n=1 Tax=Ensete ventricosum TaxID=4639 RepID=A0A426XYY3_ENSVE|nr:hypothetical protein B296_00036123 [Ensete ventricosum]
MLCLRLRSALGTAASFLTERRAGSGRRFLLYDRSAANSGMEGRSLLRSAIPGVELQSLLRSAISGWKGGGFFSPRRGTTCRARNGGGCAAIGAGFTAALRSCGKSGVETATAASAIGDSGVGRVVASSPLGGWRSLGRETPWMRAAIRGTLLRIPLLCSNGMLLHWLLPSDHRRLLHSGTPLSSSRWLLHSGRGLLLSSSRWFLPSGLGRFHTRMFHRWFILGGMLLR